MHLAKLISQPGDKGITAAGWVLHINGEAGNMTLRMAIIEKRPVRAQRHTAEFNTPFDQLLAALNRIGVVGQELKLGFVQFDDCGRSDPRFDALERKELDRVRIEISVLSPMQPVDDPETIVPGRDGVQLASGSRVAVFLPQVAKEQGWDREELLDNLSLKAGLKKGSWKQSRLSAFQATVFGEEPDDGAA